MEIKVVLDNGAYMPEKAHDADAGFDLRTPVDVTVPANGCVTIDTGVHVAIPRGYVGFIKSKSGLNVNNDLTCEGVIDAEFVGSIRAKLYSRHCVAHHFEAGDKITQLVILPIPEVEMVQMESLEETERGDRGFGSSGR